MCVEKRVPSPRIRVALVIDLESRGTLRSSGWKSCTVGLGGRFRKSEIGRGCEGVVTRVRVKLAIVPSLGDMGRVLQSLRPDQKVITSDKSLQLDLYTSSRLAQRITARPSTAGRRVNCL